MRRLLTLSLLLNEIVTNSAKHAFPAGATGTITVKLDRETEDYVLTVSDDGKGVPIGFDPGTSRGLGTRIMRGLAAELGGTLAVDRNGGTKTQVTFPIAA
jgi:two-component sensor histidine kinase